MEFTYSPFAILDKNMNALDYQKKTLYMKIIGKGKVSFRDFIKNLNK